MFREHRSQHAGDNVTKVVGWYTRCTPEYGFQPVATISNAPYPDSHIETQLFTGYELPAVGASLNRVSTASYEAARFVLMAIRVLIADDNSLMRRQIRALLELDTDVDLCAEAVDGLEAVQRAQECHPDVAVVDFQMPLMNGLEAARRIKALTPFVHVLIFALDYSSLLEWEGKRAGGR